MAQASDKFSDLGAPRHVWVVSAPRGETERLMVLHDALACRFTTRDRIVYTGNYLGTTTTLIDEILAFRAALLAKSGVEPWDFVCLRGPAEEAWQRLLRIQFAAAPFDLMETLIDNGVEPWLRLYGSNAREARAVVRAGNVAMTKWTLRLREAQRACSGHESFMSSLRRAAFFTHHPDHTEDMDRVIVVPAGFDAQYPLEEQGSRLWDSHALFAGGDAFKCVVRGIAEPPPLTPTGGTMDETVPLVRYNGNALTIDGWCGYTNHTRQEESALVCVALTAQGSLHEVLAVDASGVLSTYGAPFSPSVCASVTTGAPPEGSADTDRAIPLSA